MAGALDTRALCCSLFVIIGAIAITIAVNVPMLLLAIVVRAASGVAWGDLTPCLVGTTYVLASANLVAKLVLELELSTFLDTLELHAFERTILLVCHKLGFKKLSDQLKGLGIELPACRDKLFVVVLAERHVEPLER